MVTELEYIRQKVNGDDDNYNDENKFYRRSFLRQLLICSVVWTTYFLTGLSFGAPTVLIPQVRRIDNSTINISDELASWLYSIHGYSAIPWVFILSFIMKRFGRKIPFMIVCANCFIGFLVFYFSSTALHLLISEAIIGMNFASNMTVSIIIVTEYSSPRYRGIFLTIKSASFFWGIWAANIIGTLFHWSNIGVLSFMCSAYTLTVLNWPESPYWLATQGRFDECKSAHRWLKGFDSNTEAELDILINSQKESRKIVHSKSTVREQLITFIKTVSLKEFYKPILLSLSTMSLYHFSGKLVYSMYVLDIIKQMTDSESSAYMGMVVLDGVTLLGMYLGCGLSKVLKRRTLLLSSSSLGVLFLYLLALYLFLIKLSIVSENRILSILLLLMFSLTISCGPMILSSSIYGELIPLRFKSSAILITSLLAYILQATLLKLSPLIFNTFMLHGAFLFYGISSSLFILIVYKYLPETKDKTLQEIEEYFKSR